MIIAAVFLSTLGNCAYISNIGPSALISKASRENICQKSASPFFGKSRIALRQRSPFFASVMSAGSGPKPINVKPSKHDIATGRDPTRLKVFKLFV